MSEPEQLPTATWLSLLSEEPEPRALEEFRDRLLADEPDPTLREQIRDQARQAAAVLERLEERRRQAREVAALNSLARRLASLHEPEELLHEVAAQSRHLLGVDVAYIMVHQGEGRLRIEAADGSMGSALRTLVLEEGEGVGGEVLRTGMPLWSESYLEDPRVTRVQTLDAVATSEQLGGILGVPLQVADTTIGVLCAADRRPRQFREREVELLASLAAHAAVALRNAQLFEGHQRAEAELRESNTTLRELDARRQRASTLRENLTSTVLSGGGVPEVAELIAMTLGGPVLVLDAEGAPLTGGPGTESLRPAEVPRAEWFRDGSIVRDDDGRRLAMTSVALRDGYAGCLVAGVASDDGDATDEDESVRLLEIGATSVALVVASERTVAEAELRTRGELVHALLAPEIDAASIRRRARAAGIDLDRIRTVAVLDAAGSDERAALRLASRLAADLRGWSADHAGQVVVLIPDADAGSVVARVHTLAGGGPPAAVGVADCAGGIDAVRTAHVAARQTAMLLLALGRPGAVARPSEVSIYRSLFGAAGRDEIAAFVTATLGGLEEHDRSHGRDLVHTLETYLRCAQHHARTCADLHIHVNTLYNRLSRIDQVLGADWRAPERALELQLAFQLRRLAEQVG